MTDAFLTAALILVITGCCSGQNALPPGPLIRAVGESVIFTPNISSIETEFFIITWNFIDGSESKIIINSAPGGSTTAPGYAGRVSVNRNTGSLELRELTLRDTGVYEVELTSSGGVLVAGTSTLNVYENISDANITGPTETLIAGNSSANLSCQATAGTIVSREWLKNGHPLSTSNRITFSEDKSFVFIDPVEGADNGEYQCILTNPVSRDIANYNLTVNYGPEDVVINGDIEVEVSRTVLLICSASSVPPPAFTWKFSGTEINVTTAKYTVENAMYGDSGDYTCVAENALTGLSKSSAVHVLTVTGPYHGPPLGAILGGVFGALACIGLVAAVVILVMKNKKSSSGTCSSDRSTSTQQSNAGELELAYADISHFKKADGGKVQFGGPATVSAQATLKLGQATTDHQETLYAEVRNK